MGGEVSGEGPNDFNDQEPCDVMSVNIGAAHAVAKEVQRATYRIIGDSKSQDREAEAQVAPVRLPLEV